MDLTELINFTAPGSTVKVLRWEDDKDLWADIEVSDAKMQAALDTLVIWADRVIPPTGAEVRANITAYQTDKAREQTDFTKKRDLEIRAAKLDSGRLTVALVRASEISKAAIPADQLDALQALAELDGEAPL